MISRTQIVLETAAEAIASLKTYIPPPHFSTRRRHDGVFLKKYLGSRLQNQQIRGIFHNSRD